MTLRPDNEFGSFEGDNPITSLWTSVLARNPCQILARLLRRQRLPMWERWRSERRHIVTVDAAVRVSIRINLGVTCPIVAN